MENHEHGFSFPSTMNTSAPRNDSLSPISKGNTVSYVHANQWAAVKGYSKIVQLCSMSKMFIKFRIFGPLVSVTFLTLFQG